jgi:hypothetical protein
VLIVGVVLVAALETTAAAVRSRQVRANRSIGPALAHELMAEILQAAYEEPEYGQEYHVVDDLLVELASPETITSPDFGPEFDETDGTRLTFDDVDDYHGWSASPPQTKNGTVREDYKEWTRIVKVQYVTPGDPRGISLTDAGVKCITVTVTDPQGEQTQLTALRSAHGIHEQVRTAQTTSVRWIGVELQTGAAPRPLLSGVMVLNEVATEVP